MKAVINAKLVFPDKVTEGSLLIEGEHITAAGNINVPDDAEIIDAGGLFVGPGLIDEHVHGFHKNGEGHDIIDDVEGTARAHLMCGTTSILPSPSYSLRMERFLSIIDQCNTLIEKGDSSVIGIHLEGPYINYRMGAGRKYAWKYSDEAFERLFLAGGKNVLMCTYAPEMDYAEAVEDMIKKYDVVPAIGHTMADPASIYRAADNGLKIITHLFDATGNYKGIKAFDMTGDPQDGVSYVALSIPGLYYEIISDRDCIHVTAPSQRLALRCAGEDHIILVSDCTFHKRAEDNGRDVNINESGSLFGSKLTAADCAKNFKRVTGIDVRQTFKCASTNAAKALRIFDRVGSIDEGKLANLVFVDEDFDVKHIVFRGNLLK